MISLLIVEDDEEFLAILARRFTRRQMAVVACETAEAALRAATQQKFSVAIIDGTLNGRDGVGLVRQLQFDEDLRVIMLSGRVDAQFADYARRVGVCEYLCKPCSLADLEAAVQRVARLPESPSCSPFETEFTSP